ncbi:uncharacterized protein LOC128675384 [Plodia interpunctella]|uniref:uncharacterized protein LOC128675384 n=1 Tax=Plodia interpunctella TaxID=58824 RepID=UPI002367892A|nr:uncharacterized protein LOC128675384 [Plodia interpunctella]
MAWGYFGKYLHCDLPRMLWNVTTMLRLVALDIDSRNKNGVPLLLKLLLPFLVFGFYYVFFFSGLWFVLIRGSQIGLDHYRMVVLSLVISTEIGPIKYYYLFWNRLATRVLLDNYLSCDAKLDPESKMSKYVLQHMSKVYKRAAIYWVIIIGNGVVFCARPLFHPTERRIVDDNFPFYGLEPSTESPNYELSIIAMVLAVIFTVFPPAQVNVLLLTIVGYTESHLIAMSSELRTLWKDAEQYCEDVKSNPGPANDVDDKVIKNYYIRNKLRIINYFHVTNIDLIRETQSIFQNAFAGELLVLIVALITELLGGLENTYIQIPFAYIQVGIECLAGQKLIDAGIIFENALYDSQWENFDVSNRRTIVCMLMNAQKTLNLTAGGISLMNFELLMRINKGIYSAYTALRTK